MEEHEMKMHSAGIFSVVPLLVLAAAAAPAQPSPRNQTIVDEWSRIVLPPAPELKAAAVKAGSSALLVLDMQKNSCNDKDRPRCVETVPAIKTLLDLARERKMMVVHSLTSTATPADIRPELAPLAGEAVVKSSVDKFYNTELEKILKDKGVTTVIIVGTMAHGAVLHTAAGASMRGLQVIVPVDGMSADTPFAELYTAWHMLNSPGTRRSTSLTRIGLITID
jgi:nicotinamidase-related amidase